MKQTVAILGASAKPERYSHRAWRALAGAGHQTLLVNPSLQHIAERLVTPRLDDITVAVDTLTMYVSPEISTALTNQILRLNPRRVIFNPGSENPELAERLRAAGMNVVIDCTLIMLANGRF